MKLSQAEDIVAMAERLGISKFDLRVFPDVVKLKINHQYSHSQEIVFVSAASEILSK